MLHYYDNFKPRNMRNIYKYVCLIFLPMANIASAQDYHLSHYDVAALYMNPAMTGMYGYKEGDYKIYSVYRSQWKAISSKPFTSTYLAYDRPFKKWNKTFGLGGYLINSKAGAGQFGTLNCMFSAAYDITNNAEGKHYLTTGLQMGILNKQFNPFTITYDVQYSPSIGGFDPNIPNQENFSRASILRFDANIGIFYKYIEKEQKVHPLFGFSIQHVTKPNESFSSINSRSPMRFNIQT